jgi:hypothetical protein
MVVFSVRTGLRADQGFAGITVDIFVDRRDRNVDIFETVKDRIETVSVIVESESGMIFPYDQLIAAVVFCQERVEYQFIVAGKDIGILKGDDDHFVSGQELVDKTWQRIVSNVVAQPL